VARPLGIRLTLENVACVTQGSSTSRSIRPARSARRPRRGRPAPSRLRAGSRHPYHGPEFLRTAARILGAHGIRVIVLGMATTPEVSAAIAETQAALSINFTPSHNPFQYHGYKFNPSDGGPATKELTVRHGARQRHPPRKPRRAHARRGRVRTSDGRPCALCASRPIVRYRQDALLEALRFSNRSRLRGTHQCSSGLSDRRTMGRLAHSAQGRPSDVRTRPRRACARRGFRGGCRWRAP